MNGRAWNFKKLTRIAGLNLTATPIVNVRFARVHAELFVFALKKINW